MINTRRRDIAARRCLLALGAIAGVVLGSIGAGASPLAETRCLELQSERTQLIAEGVQSHLEKGPAWARDNLPRETIDKIAKLIDIDEQLSFRCPLKFSVSPLKPVKPEQEDEDEKTAEDATRKPGADTADAEPTGTAVATPTRRPARGPNSIPLPERRPQTDSQGAAPALRGSIGLTTLPTWATDSRSR